MQAHPRAPGNRAIQHNTRCLATRVRCKVKWNSNATPSGAARKCGGMHHPNGSSPQCATGSSCCRLTPTTTRKVLAGCGVTPASFTSGFIGTTSPSAPSIKLSQWNSATRDDQEASQLERTLKEILWLHLNASLDMLDNAMSVCPDELWERPSHEMGFWYIAY